MANLVNLRVIKRSPVCELEALIPTVLFELPPFSKLRKFYQILHQTLTNQTLFAKVVDANVSIFYNGLKLNFITKKKKKSLLLIVTEIATFRVSIICVHI